MFCLTYLPIFSYPSPGPHLTGYYGPDVMAPPHCLEGTTEQAPRQHTLSTSLGLRLGQGKPFCRTRNLAGR